MAGRLPGNPSHHEIASCSAGNYTKEEPLSFTGKWYFTKEEIEEHSPSRKDGITHKDESHLRKLYCSFLQELGMELKVPQVTIATAMLFCHRFYMRQSHAKNYWQTIATASMFLSSKAEETPRWLSDLVAVAYRLANKWDPLAPQKIRQRDIYDQQKETILLGERLLLATLAFDLNVEHPYKPLVAAVKKLEIPQKELVKVAWNFVNDWFQTTMCLQYKPHYIAAGSLFLAAKVQKVKLPKTEGKVWWMQFDVSPKQLEDVIQHMLRLLEQNQKQELPPGVTKVTKSKSVTSGKVTLNSPESCISNGSVAAQVSNISLLDAQQASTYAHSMCCQEQRCSDICDNIKETEVCQISDCGSANSTVDDGDIELKMGQSGQISGIKHASSDASYANIDVHRIKEKLKMRRLASANCTVVENGDMELKVGQSGPSSGIKHPSSDNAYNSLDVRRIKERIKMRRLASANSTVEDGDIDLKMGQCAQISGIKHAASDASYNNIDVHRIKERLKMRRLARCTAKLDIDNDFEMDNEAWIEKELESGVELSTSPDKQKRC